MSSGVHVSTDYVCFHRNILKFAAFVQASGTELQQYFNNIKILNVSTYYVETFINSPNNIQYYCIGDSLPNPLSHA